MHSKKILPDRKVTAMFQFSQIGMQPDFMVTARKARAFISLLSETKKQLGNEGVPVLAEFIQTTCFALGELLDGVSIADDALGGFSPLRRHLKALRDGEAGEYGPYKALTDAFLRDHGSVRRHSCFMSICCLALAEQAVRIETDRYINGLDKRFRWRFAQDDVQKPYRALCALLGENKAEYLRLALMETLIPISPAAMFSSLMAGTLCDTLAHQDEDGNTVAAYGIEHLLP